MTGVTSLREGEVCMKLDGIAFFSAKRCDRSTRADLIESATLCHDAQILGVHKVEPTLPDHSGCKIWGLHHSAPQHVH